MTTHSRMNVFQSEVTTALAFRPSQQGRGWLTLGKKVKVKVVVTQLCPTLCDSVDCNPPGSCPRDSPGKNIGPGCHYPSVGDLPNPGIEPRSPALQADSLPSEPPGKLWVIHWVLPSELPFSQEAGSLTWDPGKLNERIFKPSDSQVYKRYLIQNSSHQQYLPKTMESLLRFKPPKYIYISNKEGFYLLLFFWLVSLRVHFQQ